jgi:hypothetical protein
VVHGAALEKRSSRKRSVGSNPTLSANYHKMKSDTRIKKRGFSLTRYKTTYLKLIKDVDHKVLAVWAIDCTERVLPFFERKFQKDNRPRKAIETLKVWINTGIFKMIDIRKASLSAHMAAREVGEDNAARSAAHAAGQTVATAHVPAHSIGAASYALQAIYRAAKTCDAETTITDELEWQRQHLLELKHQKVN